jgi:hypothetical protein
MPPNYSLLRPCRKFPPLSYLGILIMVLQLVLFQLVRRKSSVILATIFAYMATRFSCHISHMVRMQTKQQALLWVLRERLLLPDSSWSTFKIILIKLMAARALHVVLSAVSLFVYAKDLLILSYDLTYHIYFKKRNKIFVANANLPHFGN